MKSTKLRQYVMSDDHSEHSLTRGWAMVPMPSMPKLVPHIIDWKAWAVATGMGSLETPSWTK